MNIIDRLNKIDIGPLLNDIALRDTIIKVINASIESLQDITRTGEGHRVSQFNMYDAILARLQADKVTMYARNKEATDEIVKKVIASFVDDYKQEAVR